jgi:preprotein translocase subunit SecA
LLREELEQFERFVLLQILDQAWKDHLHSMDQMRDSISFRSFSQKDPRIEFKKESSRLFGEMLSNVRERVTDLVFKGKLSPQAMRPPTPSVVTNETEIDQTAEKIAEPTASAQIASVVPTQAQERDIAIAEQAGAPTGRTAAAVAASGTSMNRAPKVVVPIGGPMAVGRNENCPCGSGKKYKQCCGKK